MKRVGLISSIIILLVVCLWACKKQSLVLTTDTSLNITGYLDSNPDEFSQFRKILGITGNAGFLNAYGAYTLFLPNNEAVKEYLKAEGKNAVEDVDIQTLKDLVKFHLIADTLGIGRFKDGKLPTLTMYGQYLITGAVFADGVTKTRINRQANLVQGDITARNGIIHVIDRMLIPAKLSIAQMVANDPKYSIFTQALRETSLFDSLNIAPANNGDRRFTLIAETDSTLNAAGYANYAALKARFSKTGNPANPNDSLRVFMQYHILFGSKYLADIISAQSHETMAKTEVITSKLTNRNVLINDDDFLGKHETGIMLNRTTSDNSTTNGVVHAAAPYTASGVTSSGHLAVKVRLPVRIDWDVADFPELRALPAFFRRASTSFPIPVLLSTIKSVDRIAALYYTYSATEVTIYKDFLNLPLGPPNRSAAFTLTTPLLVKGKYKVWMNYKFYQKSTSTKSCASQVSIDGVPLQRLIDGIAKRPAGTAAELEAQGWKQYITGQTSTNYNGRLLGVIDLPSTKRYSMQIKWVSGGSMDTYIDVVQFIPVDQDQIRPMINTDGTREF
jgi:uncharacterized surface protein with fasciclin (FAS1) repeats